MNCHYIKTFYQTNLSIEAEFNNISLNKMDERFWKLLLK